jgi:protein-S-isoprenylcysteine O-methyltransferase Ste14
MAYGGLVIIWISWCALHSVLISITVTEALRVRFPQAHRYFRLLYNLTALTTLVPVLWVSASLRGEAIVRWDGPLVAVPIVLATAALFFFAAGGRRYDFLQFAGIRQLNGENDCAVLTDDCSLDTEGILGVVRHPWYTGGLLIVWARPLDLAAILTNLVICGYFVVGAFLEERKLKRRFGEPYVAYQRRVSMFFPIKWAATRMSGRHYR